MEILGIGASELIFILIIAIIVLGPKDMQRAGRTIGRWLNQLVHSDTWKVFQRTSAEIRNLPRNLMREANMEQLQEMDKEIRQSIDPRRYPTTSRSTSSQNPSHKDVSPERNVGDTSQSTEVGPSQSSPAKTDSVPEPPVAKPTDVNADTKQDE
jgi:sec-independent protein translocase protein TatB